MKPFSLLIKPSSADCNLRCAYCFYLDRAELFPETRQHRMSDATLACMVRSFLATEQPQYTFGWQGGEPTLMGLEFFKRVTELQRALGRPGAMISNGFQTNATRIDDEWARHFAKYNFLVGVSVDGPATLHDRFRLDIGGRPSHARVLQGIAALKRQHVEYNVLTLVSQANVRHPETVYEYLCAQGVKFHQYIECVEFDAAGRPRPFAIGPAEWGDFLCRLFDRWYPKDVYTVSIRLFDTILAQLVDNVSNTCAAGTSCDQYFVVEYNGDVFPCDFHVQPEWRLGNIHRDGWDVLQGSALFHDFAARKRQWHEACHRCPWLRFCNGDCPKNRIGAASGAASHLCAGWKRFHAHALPRLRELAQEVLRRRAGLAAGPAAPAP